MDSRSCDSHGDTSSHQHINCFQWTDGEAKQQRLYDGGVHQTPAVQGNSNRRRLGFQIKAAGAEAESSPSKRTRRALLYSCRQMLVREWGKLGSVIKRAAAVCLTPSSAGADDYGELDLPYVQLDKVTALAVRREAFGPLYLVT